MKEDTFTIHNYQRIYTAYAPILIRFARKFVSDFLAEDMVQDVFLRLWDKKVFLLCEDELKRVLYTSVKNACIDQLRRAVHEQAVIDYKAVQLKLDELDFFESSDELFMREDILSFLMKKIEELPERNQQIFRLVYLQGMKASEVAEKLGLSVRTVENQLYRALLYLRKHCSHLFPYIFILC